MKVGISGGGRTGHLYAVLLKQIPGVQVLWHSRKAQSIREQMPVQGIALLKKGEVVGRGTPELITDKIEEVASSVDVMIFTQTNDGIPQTVAAAAPHFARDRPTYVGAIPALGSGFDWLVSRETLGNESVFTWGLRGVPATSPSIDIGKTVTLGAFKDVLYLGFAENVPAAQRSAISEMLSRIFPQETVMLNHFLEMTLSPPSLHPAVLYGLMGPFSQWDGKPFQHRIRWWTDLTELSAYFMRRCDDEIQSLIEAVEQSIGVSLKNAGSMHGKQIDQYRTSIEDPRTLMSAYRTNSAFQSFIPMDEQPDGGFLFRKSHPGVRADLLYSLNLYLEIGKRLGKSLPHVKEVFDWGMDFIGETSAFPFYYLPDDFLRPSHSAAAA